MASKREVRFDYYTEKRQIFLVVHDHDPPVYRRKKKCVTTATWVRKTFGLPEARVMNLATWESWVAFEGAPITYYAMLIA